MKNIKHLSFDVWLTLIRSNPDFKKARTHLIKTLFDIPFSFEEVEKTIAEQDRLFTLLNEKTGKNIDREEMLLLMLAQLNVDISLINTRQIDDFFRKLESAFWRYQPFFIDDDLEEIFIKAKENNISLSIFSNTGLIRGHILSYFFENRGLSEYFDFELYSDELDISKPSILAFETILKRVLRLKKVEKINVCHIGDNLVADVEGATNFGFSALHYDCKLLKMNDLLEKNGIF